MNVTYTAKLTDRHTVNDWFKLYPDVCVIKFKLRLKMGGTFVIVQIDELSFQEKRNYHRGRLYVDDHMPTITHTSHVSSDSSDDYGPVYKNCRSREQGPWVFELCCKLDDGVTDGRSFYSLKE